MLELTDLISLSDDGLSPTVNELYISSVSLPVNEPYQTLVSLRQSILCGYDNVFLLLLFVFFFVFFFVCFFFWGGGGGAWYAS